MVRRLCDPAWEHCTKINIGKANRVKCNYCSHRMWGGVSRMKEHLAKKRGGVIPCPNCPPEVSSKMRDLLIKTAFAKEQKLRHRRESLEKMKVESSAASDIKEEDENDCLKRAMKESLETYEKEKKEDEEFNDSYDKACRESIMFFEMEKRFRGGQGCSGSASNMAGPSHDFNDSCIIDLEVDSDYDNDLGF
ncbi:putative Zinc finger, BED-type [Corchorus olitorius]|uniref:Zinc finger, BED-type n=1 Tax=Corchorus olitorius TaxID=93759 RepID=A0A1R3GNE1_9ROSI|nr:putative Zinc finger, BED-type [Corchorus olitorius]